MRIAILALEGMFDTGFTVMLDAFSVANNFSTRQMGGGTLFRCVYHRRAQEGSIPTWTDDTGATGNGRFEAGLGGRSGAEYRNTGRVAPALGRPDVAKAKAQLLKWHAEGALIAASCIGTFLLAETGLLDHREATTTWWLGPFFRQRYPNVLLDESRMLVPTDVGVTAGAAMGHLDLALWLIRRASPELAALVSRYLLADIRASQASYIIPNHLAQADPLILRFEKWAREHLKSGFSLQEAAGALATSARSLQRRCQEVLGKSPLAYFQDLRVEHAQSLLHGSGLGLDAIAAEVGYVDGATLRTLLRQRLGRGVRDLRADLR